jgi:hypothetical protein
MLNSFHARRRRLKEPTSSDGFLQVLNGSFLAVEMLALCVMKPAKLLQYLGVVGIPFEDPMIRDLCVLKLRSC